MGLGLLTQAARVRPPVGATELAVTTSASAAQSLGTTGGSDVWYTFICTQAFNLEFDEDATPPDPSANYMFAAGVMYSFNISKQVLSFKARATAAGTLKWWRSSYA